MGLDMYIYKQLPEYTSVAKKRKALEKTITDEIEALYNKHSVGIIKKVEDFILKHKAFIPNNNNTAKSRLISILKNTLLYPVNNQDLQWRLFNYYSAFNFDIKNSDRISILQDFNETFSEYFAKKPLKSVTNYDTIKDIESKLEEEVCYWRKYYNLNDFILETYGGDNCKKTRLSKKRIKELIKFIEEEEDGEDIKDTSQLLNLLDNWDSSCKYYYLPWW